MILLFFKGIKSLDVLNLLPITVDNIRLGLFKELGLNSRKCAQNNDAKCDLRGLSVSLFDAIHRVKSFGVNKIYPALK